MNARALIEACTARGLTIAVAESCTGGLICAALTDVPGASRVLDRGFITYSNAAKTELLGVAPDALSAHGAVSAPTAQQMAEGAIKNSNATLSVAVTGIAGPGGGTADKPVGLVFIAIARRGDSPCVARHVFPGDRDAVRRATVEAALAALLQASAQNTPHA